MLQRNPKASVCATTADVARLFAQHLSRDKIIFAVK